MPDPLDRLAQSLLPAAWGRRRVVELLLAALLSEGHVLIEDVPGVGKTSIIRALAECLGLEYRRLQFTPDLLPSDVTGFSFYDARSGLFALRRGPVFTNLLLADEINRTSPKTQSSLLESMEERQVTIDGEIYALPRPFMVFATENPVEYEGTFPLPEAQLDRFLFRIAMGYPDPAAERAVLEREGKDQRAPELMPVLDEEELESQMATAQALPVGEPVADYALRVAQATRGSRNLRLGVSPRGVIAWIRAARSLAHLRHDPYVTPDHLREVAGPTLAHRIVLSVDHSLKGTSRESVLADILDGVALPAERARSQG